MISKEAILNILAELDFASLNGDLVWDAKFVKFSLLIDTREGESPLSWEVAIVAPYPMKVNGHASISFTNQELLPFPHIMRGGELCLHTTDALTEEDQFRQDLIQLKSWVDKYYVNKEVDAHYENLVVNSTDVDGVEYHFLFTELKEELTIGDYGMVRLCSLQNSSKRETKTSTYLAYGFQSRRVYQSEEKVCDWDSHYLFGFNNEYGAYCMLTKAPEHYGKFIIENFAELEPLFDQTQKDFIYRVIKKAQNSPVDLYPLFCGYKTPDNRTYWQVILLDVTHPPIKGIKHSTSTGPVWHTTFTQDKIYWANTVDASYEYFFGRGAMPSELAAKKFFIIGVGAVGSIVAKTLTRCGARYIDVYDFDIKEPGNVCRSEYEIFNGIGDKSSELQVLLYRISPFVTCRVWNSLFDYQAKSLNPEEVRDVLNKYDVIFDCTTDNHLMVLLDSLSLKAQVVNLSITNHAKELTCVFSPQITRCIEFLYSKLLTQDKSDMFNPSGCWNPTFKASYNDISLMVQFALKRIIQMLSSLEPISNFYIDEKEGSLTINKL
ncbi:MAG: ThiF family adenylyltransferase [Porphyromonas sp.]|uniref:ThiF family adenylyltransferase n=1 Tax=Porphyromonas sp. TaxID=1924944 RepID=UPI001CAAC003|nr:ThiF family adenylyltransferase [Porphyromonas sp.]MBF1404669.1 ThiF family adenylyltransferase [Porphyromonas sp.]